MTRYHSTTADESRRGFIRGSSLLLASALPSPRHSQRSVPLKLGLIGCGRSGVKLTDKILKRSESLGLPVELSALSDVFEDQLQKAARGLKGRNKSAFHLLANGRQSGISGYRKLLQLDLDAVLIAVPPALRAAMVEASIAAGKHVFVEQPAAVDAKGLRKLLQASSLAASANLILHLRHRHSLAHRYREQLAMLKDGALGEVIELQHYCQLPAVLPRYSNSDSRGSFGSTLSDLQRLRDWKVLPAFRGDGTLEERATLIEVAGLLWGKDPMAAEVQSQVHYGGHQQSVEEQPTDDQRPSSDPWGFATRLDSTIRFDFDADRMLSSRCLLAPGRKRLSKLYVCGSKGHGDLESGKFYDASHRLIERIAPAGNDRSVDLDAFLLAIQWNRTGRQEGIPAPFPAAEASPSKSIQYCWSAIMGQLAGLTGQRHDPLQTLNSRVEIGPQEFA